MRKHEILEVLSGLKSPLSPPAHLLPPVAPCAGGSFLLMQFTEEMHQIAALRRGNAKLIEALMDMVNQFFYTKDNGLLQHSFMSAEEGAIATLVNAGFAEETDHGYRLLWDKLVERYAEVGL